MMYIYICNIMAYVPHIHMYDHIHMYTLYKIMYIIYICTSYTYVRSYMFNCDCLITQD